MDGTSKSVQIYMFTHVTINTSSFPMHTCWTQEQGVQFQAAIRVVKRPSKAAGGRAGKVLRHDYRRVMSPSSARHVAHFDEMREGHHTGRKGSLPFALGF